MTEGRSYSEKRRAFPEGEGKEAEDIWEEEVKNLTPTGVAYVLSNAFNCGKVEIPSWVVSKRKVGNANNFES